MRSHRSRAGFTLIEMAIVVSIIGLIVGGIVASQSFVRNSELNTMMNETKFYISAFNQFQTKYNAVAGDMADASNNWPSAFNGDGNGQILSSQNAGATALPEVFYAFQHLSLSGMVSGSYTGATSSFGTFAAQAATNLPASTITGVAYMLDHPDYTDGDVSVATDTVYPPTAVAGLYNHVLRVAALADSATGLPSGGFITGKEGYQLDDKYDDGLPNTGAILTPPFGQTGSCVSPALNANAYYVAIAAPSCFLILRIN